MYDIVQFNSIACYTKRVHQAGIKRKKLNNDYFDFILSKRDQKKKTWFLLINIFISTSIINFFLSFSLRSYIIIANHSYCFNSSRDIPILTRLATVATNRLPMDLLPLPLLLPLVSPLWPQVSRRLCCCRAERAQGHCPQRRAPLLWFPWWPCLLRGRLLRQHLPPILEID